MLTFQSSCRRTESVQRLHENLRSYIKLVNPFALRSVAADPPAVVPEAGPLADAVTSTTAAQEDDLLASDGGAAPPSAPETAVNGDADAPQTSTDVPEVVMADASPRQTGAEGGGTVEQGGTSLASGPGVATEPSAVSEDDEAVVAAQLLALSGSAPTDAAGATAAAPTVNGVDGSEAMVEAAAGTNGEAGPLNATTATTTEANPFLNGLLEVDQGVELSAEEKEARRRKTMLQIAEHMNRSIKLAQDKVNLATTVYDWVRRPPPEADRLVAVVDEIAFHRSTDTSTDSTPTCSSTKTRQSLGCETEHCPRQTHPRPPTSRLTPRRPARPASVSLALSPTLRVAMTSSAKVTGRPAGVTSRKPKKPRTPKSSPPRAEAGAKTKALGPGRVRRTSMPPLRSRHRARRASVHQAVGQLRLSTRWRSTRTSRGIVIATRCHTGPWSAATTSSARKNGCARSRVLVRVFRRL